MKFFAEDNLVNITGRTLYQENTRYLSYSGSSISFTFHGQKAQVRILSDAKQWEPSLKGWIAVYVNHETVPSKRLALLKDDDTYTVFEATAPVTATIQIMKYSEAAFGKCGICEIEIDTDELLPPPAAKQRKIEIIGDSITCGYGVESENELETFDTAKENPMKSYSLLTAHALDADVNLVSWSGIGVISRYVPEDVNEPLDDWLMPMLYQYTDASCSKDFFHEEETQWEVWNNEKFVPDIIIINLGTNDSSYCREIAERNQVFRDEYYRFLKMVRSKNSTSEILCILGTMDQRLCTTLEALLLDYQSETGDFKIHYLHLPFHPEEDGRGADFHPSICTQQKTAVMVTSEVKQIMHW